MRSLLNTLTAALMLTGTVTLPQLSHAAAPVVGTQAPAFYRMMVGDIEVTALSDGTVNLPMAKLLQSKNPKRVSDTLKRDFLGDTVETSVNAYLVNTGTKLVLIDTGAGVLFGPTLGKLLINLKAAGYSPDQVDDIYITHMHPDHVGGLMTDGQMAFANATLHIDQADTEFWLNDAKMNAAPADQKGFFQGAMASVNPYKAAGKLQPFKTNSELTTGIRAQATHGHTAGHNIYIVENKGAKLVLWGDLVHVGAVQFAEPNVTIAFDSDSKNAEKQRQAAFADAAKQGYLIGASHLPFPGVGHVRKATLGSGYTFIPVNYSSLVK